MSHRCLFNKPACFFDDDINDSLMLPMCSHMAEFHIINLTVSRQKC